MIYRYKSFYTDLVMKYSVLLACLLFITMSTSGQSTEFYLPVGPGYTVTLLELKHEKDQVSARIEVTPEIWESIDMIMMFNLTWNNRNEGSVSGEKPVQIVMMLSKNLYAELKESGSLITDAPAFIQAPKDHPMKKTNQWYAIEVTEEVTLPSHLADKGTIREGFTTTWKNEFN